MKKYTFIGIMLVLIGNANLLWVLMRQQTKSDPAPANVFFGTAVVILLGLYVLRLASNKALADL